MEYRVLPHGGEQISVIGFGGSGLKGSVEEMTSVISAAIDAGVNFFDLALAEAAPFPAYGRAFAGRRDRVLTQMHFGAVYEDGKYGWTRDLKRIETQFEEMLRLTGTDYTDFGFIHCVDEDDDLDAVMNDGLWDYILKQKDAGRVRHLGFSSHDPHIARRVLETGLIDLFMFSINPAYDYRKGEFGLGEVADRAALYRDCERMGVGISVMKPFGGGQLLDAKTSPFGRALTHEQCIQYALDRPAVLTVLPGVRDMDELRGALAYLDAPAEARDYSVIGEFTPQDAYGNCVYCNHCQPCPAGLNIGLINKYYDLSKAGDVLAAGHYDKLSLHAGDCIQCGHCDRRCPFHVEQSARMREIDAYFSALKR